jgi:hypothetical protein
MSYLIADGRMTYRTVSLLCISLLVGCAAPASAPHGTPQRVEGEQPKDIEGVGYAVVHSQPGKTPEQRRLVAIRAARLAAMRDLAEQVYGARVTGDTTMTEMRVQDDQLRASVDGLVQGARTVRINPVSGDTYEVVLRLPGSEVERLLRTIGPG